MTAALATFNTFEGRSLNNFENFCETDENLPGEELDDGQGFTVLDLLNESFYFFFLVLKLMDDSLRVILNQVFERLGEKDSSRDFSLLD